MRQQVEFRIPVDSADIADLNCPSHGEGCKRTSREKFLFILPCSYFGVDIPCPPIEGWLIRINEWMSGTNCAYIPDSPKWSNCLLRSRTLRTPGYASPAFSSQEFYSIPGVRWFGLNTSKTYWKSHLNQGRVRRFKFSMCTWIQVDRNGGYVSTQVIKIPKG
jgi:hypothetical protein